MLNFRCHGVDKKGNNCENSVGLFHYFFGSALCIDCEIELLQLRIHELKVKKKIQNKRGRSTR